LFTTKSSSKLKVLKLALEFTGHQFDLNPLGIRLEYRQHTRYKCNESCGLFVNELEKQFLFRRIFAGGPHVKRAITSRDQVKPIRLREKLDTIVSRPHRRSTTVSLKTNPLACQKSWFRAISSHAVIYDVIGGFLHKRRGAHVVHEAVIHAE